MPGDAALRLLVDIQARDSTRGVIGGLTAGFFGLSAVFKQVSAAFATFGEARKLANLAGLANDAGHVDAAVYLMGQSLLKSKAGMAQFDKAVGQLLISLVKFLAILTLVAGVIAIAIGVAAVKAASDFQQGLQRLVTGAGDVTDNMNLMGQAILGISTDTGVLTNELLPAMYQILSAGQRGAEAENTLAVAARGAVIEQANVVDVAKALTTAMTDYGTAQFNATQFMNGYIKAVSFGRITLEELATTLGPILPLAKNVGISFADMAAAMSTMTNAGIPAARAATSLRFLIQNLENPTKKETTAMQEMGLNSIALGNELKKSLPGALQMVYDAARKAGPEGSVPFNRAISDMIGGQRSLQAFLGLTGGHMKTFASDSKQISAAMSDAAKNSVQGWQKASQNFNVQFGRIKAGFQALLIFIGTNVLPGLTTFAGHVADIMSQAGQAFLKVFGPAEQTATAFGHVHQKAVPMTSAIGHGHANMSMLAGSTKQVAQNSNPLIGIFQGIKDAFNHVKDAAIAVYNFFVPIVAVIRDWLKPLFQALAIMIQTVLIPAWLGFVNAIKPYMPALLDLAKIVGVVLVAAFIAVIGIIVGVIMIIGLLVAAFLWIITAITNVERWVQTAIKNIIGFFVNLYHTLVGGSIIPQLVTAIVTWFAGLPGKIMAAIASLPGKLAALFLSIASAAVSWGASIINNFLAGLQAAWNAVVSWVQGALSWLASQFPHSPVKDGPLRGSENWGYNFGMNIADGIRRSIPAVQSASSLLASAVGNGYSGSYSMSYGGSRYPTGGAVIVNHITIMPPSIKLDGAEVTDKIMQRGITDIRRHGGPIKR